MAVILYYPAAFYLSHAYQTVVRQFLVPKKIISKQLTYFNKTRYECHLKVTFLNVYNYTDSY